MYKMSKFSIFPQDILMSSESQKQPGKFVRTFLAISIAVIILLSASSIQTQAGMLDSLDIATLDSALVLLNLKPEELGFDKLWASDDTFRLAVVEKYLNNPYEFPDYVDESQTVVDSFYLDPGELIRFFADQLKVDPDAKPVVLPEPLQLEYDPIAPFDLWMAALTAADPHLSGFYSELDSLDIHDILLGGPGMWGDDENDSIQALTKGKWQREFNVDFDSTRDAGSDRILDIMKKMDMDELLQAGMITVPVAQSIARNISESGYQSDPVRYFVEGVTGRLIFHAKTEWGTFVIGDTEDNTYEGDFAAIIDLGGNDTYRGRCAGAIGELGNAYSLLIDLEGDDYYDSDDLDVAHGAGVLGIGILIDRDGNDTYRSGGYSQGAGMFGIGFHVDHNGADDRRGRYFMQGAGHCGVGVLIDTGDEKSDDRYLGSTWSQGFAGVYGYGLLFDDGGDDTYRTGGTFYHAPLLPNDYQSFSGGFGMGWRPRAGGGIGMLYDRGNGNDFYDAEVMALGSSYWYSIGMLIDGGGNDSYNLAQYGMGVGIHLSLGAMYEMGGDDQYHSRHGVVGATAHDLSVGLMVDSEGDDFYIVGDGWGGSLTNSYGLFIDKLGNDLYATRGGAGYSFGKARWARGFAGAAIFLDLEGKDTYPKNVAAKDSSIWISSGWGIGMDLPREVKSEKEETFTDVEPTAEDSAKSLSELYRLANQWEVGSAREEVARSRKAMLAKGTLVLEFIINGPHTIEKDDISNLDSFLEKLQDEENPLSIHLYGELLGATDHLINEYEQSTEEADSIRDALSDTLRQALVDELNQMLNTDSFYNAKLFRDVEIEEDLLKEVKADPEGIELFRTNWHLLEQAYPSEIIFRNGRLRTRASLENRVLDQIVKAMPDSAGPMLIEKLAETSNGDDLRYFSNNISLLGTLKWKPAVEPLLELLEDKNLEKARNSIIGTLGSIGEIEAAKPIHKYLNADTEKRRITTMGALGALKDSTAIESMTELLNDKFFTVRSRAMMTISGFGALAIPHLLYYIGNEDSDHPESALYIIGRIARNLEKKEDVASKKTIYEASTILNGHLSNQREHMRAEAVVGLYRIGGEETRRLIDARMENEFNPVVLAAHERVTKEMAGK